MPVDSTHEHQHPEQTTAVEYSCPMHPEIVQSKPGSCPKCGMFLEPREHQDNSPLNEHVGMDHGSMNHDDMTFMSMIDITKDLPRSKDDLPMDWIDVPFGPFFPGLPGGLLLTLTLDGDTVAGANAQMLVENVALAQQPALDAGSFVERLAEMQPLSPLTYRLLACRAIENAANIELPAATVRSHIGALERERISSHLNWLALFGQQTGLSWLQRNAASLQLKYRQADCQQMLALRSEMARLSKRLHRTPLLKSRTAGIGQLESNHAMQGPVARANGINNDVRSTDPAYAALGFKPSYRETGDILARLQLRLDEISHSLSLIEAADSIELPALTTVDKISGDGEAMLETPRGMAQLQLTLAKGRVITAQLDTPSTQHLSLIDTLTEQQAIADALLAVGSLDLSPWEVRQW